MSDVSFTSVLVDLASFRRTTEMAVVKSFDYSLQISNSKHSAANLIKVFLFSSVPFLHTNIVKKAWCVKAVE